MAVLTVVIPVYRNRDRVAATINSVFSQPDVEARVIAVIDDQCDETRAILRQFGDSIEVVVNDRTRGAPYCRTRGLARAATRHVMFLDSDEYLEGPLLRGICSRLDETGAVIGFGPTIMEFEDGRPRRPLALPGADRATMFAEW